jgi:hypothetical protein
MAFGGRTTWEDTHPFGGEDVGGVSPTPPGLRHLIAPKTNPLFREAGG